MLPREAANIHPEKHNILVFLSNTLFSPFYVPSPSLFLISKNGRYLGGTWEERFRFTFVTSSLSNRYQSEVLSKIYRRSIEDLSKTYRTSIEDLSNIYRRVHVSTVLSTSYGLSFAPKNGYIAKYLLIDRYFSFNTFKFS